MKYEGIPAPWECESDSRRLGFKCLKYVNWKAVHASKDSRAALKSIGSSLIDEGTFPVGLYREFGQVWERVRRWAKDKENLSVPATVTPGFDRVARELQLASKDFRYVQSFVQEATANEQFTSGELYWQFFKALAVFGLLSGSSAMRSCQLDPLPAVSAGDEAFLLGVDSYIAALYGQLGFEVTLEELGSGVDLFLTDLGIACDCPIIPDRLPAQVIYRPPLVALELKERGDLSLVKFRMVGGVMVVSLNSCHPALSNQSQFGAMLKSEEFWLSFGEGCLDQLGTLDEIQQFTDAWGVHLAARARKAIRDT